MVGMPVSKGGVRAGRSTTTIAVTGAGGALGSRLVRRLVADGSVKRVVAIDISKGDLDSAPAQVMWRRADVRDPVLRSKFAGVDTVVHLATDRRPDAAVDERRALNVHGTDTVLAAAVAAGVSRVVLLTSAMVYGAHATNPVPLAEDAPLRAEPDLTLVGDWVEMERLAAVAARAHPSVRVIPVRPASVVGPGADAMLPRLFEAPRLLSIKDMSPHWQFCHVDDLLCALEWAATGRVDAAITVGCDGWLDQGDVERISGLRSIVVPASMAFSTAERLHRIGVLPAPSSELHYLAHPWVVASQRLRDAGWAPEWDNEAALRAHLAGLGDRIGRGMPRLQRKDATRAAAGATVALVGTVAIARARAARRKRRG
jgi:nucleoside-diphosphate-sugar epimerase